MPYWTFFSVQVALRALEEHLAAAAPYRQVDILQFQRGVRSEGIATRQQSLDAARRHGARARLVAVDPSRFPHDIATLGRYGGELARLLPAGSPWRPLDPHEALRGLQAAGLQTG